MELIDWVIAKRELLITSIVICVALSLLQLRYHSSSGPSSRYNSNNSNIDTTMRRSNEDSSSKSNKKVKFDTALDSPDTSNIEAHPSHAGTSDLRRMTLTKGQQSFKKYNEGADGDVIARKPTHIEEEVLKQVTNAEHIVDALPKDDSQIPNVDLFLPELLKDATFVGHLVTDLDSVAGAIGAAALYGGKAALASDVNSETQFALDYWKVETPPKIEDVLKEKPNVDICLVDHQQTSQMNPNINVDQIVGVIDHHALQSKTIVTDKPIYIDIRPWGSMSTIIAHTFLTHTRRPPVSVAGMLLCAILSDTLNLQGPTTTDWDRLMVAVLADIAGVDDIQLLASQQFKAKSKELANMSGHALVNGDQKTFSFEASGFNGDIGFAVVETTDVCILVF